MQVKLQDNKVLFFAIVLFLFFFLFDRVCSYEDSFFQILVSRYEYKMQVAAKYWKDKKYLLALDGFYSARELVDDNMPQPSESFAWQGCLTFKIYSLVLARLVESEYYTTTGQKEMVENLINQAFNWGLKLKQAIHDWDRIETAQSWEDTLRLHWIHLYQIAIEQIRKKIGE